MITLTMQALDKILSLIEKEDEKELALRIAIQGRGPGGFQYQLGFVKETEQQADDVIVDMGAFKIFIDEESAAHLKGAIVDYVTQGFQGGFQIDNPNPLWDDPTAQQVQEVIDHQINPQIASHGGVVSLLEVKNDTAFVALGGGCQGCGLADVTLKQGIEVMIKRAVPAIKKIIDTTDHAAGTNPYYQPSKGGESPLA